jgi:outer membrane protein OmpA-like peptidoglycan-associated protein
MGEVMKNNNGTIRKIVLLTIFAMIITGISGCTGKEAKNYQVGTKDNGYTATTYAGVDVVSELYEGGIAFVIGNTANQPSPAVSDNVLPILNRAFITENKNSSLAITVVSASGHSEHALLESDNDEISVEGIVDGASDNNNKRRAENNREAIKTLFATGPDQDHLDFLGAMKEAVIQLKGKAGRKLIVVIGSGLNDTGILNFASDPSLLDESPEKIVSSLLENTDAHVSENTFADCDIIFAGLGQTQLPQPVLEDEGTMSRNNLREIYKAVVTNLGGTVISIDDSPNNGSAIETDHIVNPTIFDITEAIEYGEDEWHFTADESLGFNPKEATFLSKEKAIKRLEVVANKLHDDPSAKISIYGYQAQSGTKRPYPTTSQLSQARAEAVKKVLVSNLGVDEKQIVEVQGKGTGEFVDEYDAGGKWISSMAPQNRVVVIKVTA